MDGQRGGARLFGRCFLLALAVAAAAFLPAIIQGQGIFTLYGDYNLQQIPFYQLAHEAVRSGELAWSWNTDLGASFVYGYSFYLLFSPFFWLTLPFPTEAVPYLMGPLMALKLALAAAFASLYLRRFLQEQRNIIIAGLLYAFSGWAVCNTFYNHFLDALPFFPLVLLSMEMLLHGERRGRGLLIAATLLTAMVNYFLFFGQLVFMALYLLCRIPSLPGSWKRLPRIGLELLLGLALAAPVLLTAALGLSGNPRASSTLSGISLLIYDQPQTWLSILHALFFPAELELMPSFFPDSGAGYASLGLWMPLLGMAGIAAFLRLKSGRWLKALLAVCLVFALIPGLNSLFTLLNTTYYARWLYMATLPMALATGLALESADASWKTGWLVNAAGVLLFAILGWLLGSRNANYMLFTALALLCAAVLPLLIKRWREHLLIAVCAVAVCVTSVSLQLGRDYFIFGQHMLDNNLLRGEVILPESPDEDDFFRVDFRNGITNQGMYLGYPTMEAFQSMVPASVLTFYDSLGIARTVASQAPPELYQLRSLLAVKYVLAYGGLPDNEPTPGLVFVDRQNDYDIYEYEYFLPLGLTYTGYISTEDFAALERTERAAALLQAVTLDNGQIAAYGDKLTEWGGDSGGFEADWQALKDGACAECIINTDGFTARRNGEAGLVLFAVPWERGWSAAVNGEAAEIVRVDDGLMAVYCGPGAAEIVFSYTTPGLRAGLIAAGMGLVLSLLYMARNWRKRAKAPDFSLLPQQEKR